MNEKLNFEAFYPHPPERVWRALTDAKAMALWLMPTDFQPRIGFRFRFEEPARGQRRVVMGEVLEVRELELLRYLWDDGESGSPSVVSWTLRPTDGGTLVSLEHAPVEAPEPYVVIEAGLNWRHALYASLPVMMALLRDTAGRPPVPVVYVAEDPRQEEPKRRAGFRQEAAACR